jgi:hypothetical protein
MLFHLLRLRFASLLLALRCCFLPSAEQGEKALGMMAAGLSNPQLVRLVRRRGLGLPLVRRLAMVSPFFGHLVVPVGPSGRALTAWVPPPGAALLGTAASLDVESG